MAPSIKLTYFPFKGRVEATRLALHVGGIPFEDERITSEEFAKRKSDGSLPFQSLPTMTVDGMTVAESNAILRYAGKLTGLYPKDEKAALKVDMVVDAPEAVITAIFSDSSKEARTKVVEETFPRYLGALNKIFAETTGPFLLGEEMSIADLKLANLIASVNKGEQFDHVPAGCLDEYSHLLASSKAVMAHEKVAEWNAAH